MSNNVIVSTVQQNVIVDSFDDSIIAEIPLPPGSAVTIATLEEVNNGVNNAKAVSPFTLANRYGATTAITINPDLANIQQYLDDPPTRYEIPSNQYDIQGDVVLDYPLWMIDQDGRYNFEYINFGTLSILGTEPAIQNDPAATGIILEMRHGFAISPNASFIKMTDGNSLMLDLVVFLLCDRPFEVDVMEFVTLEAMPFVACNDGALVNDADTCSARLLQYNAGPGTGGVGITLSGAASGRHFANACDARPVTGESYYEITADYAGDVQVTGGVLSTGGGPFFKVGTRDQTDIDIDVQSVKNVKNSQASVGAYIADGDEAVTDITALDDPVVIAGTWTEANAERFTSDANGRFTYIGKEARTLRAAVKMLIDPVGGSNRQYWAFLRKNGTDLIQLSRDKSTVDAANPGKMILFANVDFFTNDYVEVVIEAKSHIIDVTAEAQSLTIG